MTSPRLPDGGSHGAGRSVLDGGPVEVTAANLDTQTPGGWETLVAPRGVAVVGASADPVKLGSVMARSLSGFPGRLCLVNPRGVPGAPDVHPTVTAAAAAGPVDLVVVCVPAAATAGVVQDAAMAGAGAVIVCGGGFAEAGPDGAAHQQALAEVAARTGVKLLGPNTSGLVVPGHRLTASFVPGVAALQPGPVAVVAASGGVNHALAFLLADAGIGVSVAAGLGNALSIGAPDLLEYLAGDGAVARATRAVALHVESVADGFRLRRAVRALTERTPVVALVVGRNDVAAFARSHTGALATSWRTTRAVLAQAGAVLVDSERELVDAVAALSRTRLTASADPGVAIVTAQAGPGLLLLDDLRGRGVRMPELAPRTRETLSGLLPPITYQRNPVDTGRPDASFGAVLAAVSSDPGVDLVAAYALDEPGALDVAAVMSALAAEAKARFVVGVGGAGPAAAAARREIAGHGVPVAADASGMAAGVAALVADARARQRLAIGPGRAPADPGPDPGPGPWDEDSAKAVLEARGVRTPPRRVCPDRLSAHRALADLASAVAVKLLDASVLHKTELDGVHLGVRHAEELDAALDRLDSARSRLSSPGGRGYLVEAMAPPGVDMIVGVRRDPVFGPVALVGLGGSVAEALGDVAVRAVPLAVGDVEDMLGELAGGGLLAGFRGGPVLSAAELQQVLAALAGLLASYPQVQEVEVNPLRLTGQGLLALDAVLVAAA